MDACHRHLIDSIVLSYLQLDFNRDALPVWKPWLRPQCLKSTVSVQQAPPLMQSLQKLSNLQARKQRVTSSSAVICRQNGLMLYHNVRYAPPQQIPSSNSIEACKPTLAYVFIWNQSTLIPAWMQGPDSQPPTK